MCPADWELENCLWEEGRLAAGVDEAGRGPLAGPVVAAAVIFPPGSNLSSLDDSKRLSASRREKLSLLIQEQALAFAWAVVEAGVIDRKGLMPATFQAMLEALGGLSPQPDFVFVDGPRLPPVSLPAEAVVRGDSKSASIAAASILAKVTRDRLMLELHDRFPYYGFAQNKGYGTAFHRQALAEHGPCPVHRRSFAPVQSLLLPLQS